ncbi:MAG TPA: hypothetical protein VHU84_01535 [Lacipirellulaceae bacterium]|jgi:hypothetical protein|nr:hypothetical protein [Lacipirellulaceae bacterium]
MPPIESTAIDGSALFRRVAFVTEVATRVKSLSGWKKTHRAPDQADGRAQEYIAGISAGELKQDLDSVYSALKQAFDFKRRDLSVADPADGTGTIITPFFSYSISISLNTADPAEAIWTKTVDNIQEAGQVISAPFAQVFDGIFRTLRFSLPSPVDLNDCIDAIEDAEISNLDVSYDRDATFCELRFAGATGAIRITADSLAIVEKHPAKIGTLIQSLTAMQALVREHSLPLHWAAVR